MAQVIVDSMTYDEICDLFRQDANLISHRIEDGKKKYKPLLKNSRSKERTYFAPMRFTSSRGFSYVLQFYNKGIEYPTKDRLGWFYYAWFRKDRGIYALSYTRMRSLYGHEFWHFNMYHPHFFDRYRERFLKDLTLSKPEVIHKYVLNNLKSSDVCVPSQKYPNAEWKMCNDGLCLCNLIHGLDTEAKTFITWDMAGIDQKDIAKKGKELISQLGFEVGIPDDNFDEFTKDE